MLPPHWSKTRLNRLVLLDLKLTPVLDEVLGKQPCRSLRPLMPAAEKGQIKLVP